MCKSISFDTNQWFIMKKAYSVALMIFLVGCSSVSSGPPTKAAIETPISSKDTPFSEHTVTPVQPTSLATQTRNVLLNGSVKQECLGISVDAIPFQKAVGTGKVLVYDDTSATSYIMDIETETQYALPLKNRKDISIPTTRVSPNGEYIAYIEEVLNDEGYIAKQNIWVIDSKGTALVSQCINAEVEYNDWRWLDNERLQLNFRSLTPKDGTVVIYYPFKNEWQYLSHVLPNFYKYSDLDPSWWLVYYNADLERVIYLGEVEEEEYVIGPILWDVTSQKVIWQAPVLGVEVKIPQWSPSGDMVAVIKEGYLYLIDHEGKITMTPNLGDDSEIMEITWSPDGEYIALLVRYNRPTIEGYLMLYDVRSNQVVDYCLRSDNLFGSRSPLWSDNSQFIYYNLNPMGNDGPPGEIPILLDVNNNKVYRISEDITPLAWVISKPK